MGAGGGHFITQEAVLGCLDPQCEAHQAPLVEAPAGLQPAAQPGWEKEKTINAKPGCGGGEESASPLELGEAMEEGLQLGGWMWGTTHLGAHLPLWDSAV